MTFIRSSATNVGKRLRWTQWLTRGEGGKSVAKPSKYKNEKETVDNIKFDSGREAGRYRELKLLQTAGVIHSLECHPRFPIEIGGVKVMCVGKTGDTRQQMVYVGDFSYYDVERRLRVIEDVKGVRTDAFRIKKALMYAMGYELTEVK